MSSYTKQEIISTINSAFEERKLIYKLVCINYKGKTSDTKEKYTEVIAEYLLNNFDILESSIDRITRSNSYRTESHDGIINNESNFNEDVFCKSLLGQKMETVGEILDYQIPLKGIRNDKAGKIDLISYEKKNNKLFLLELKRPQESYKDDETLLRSVLEIYTYSKQINQVKFLEDFNLPNAIITPSVFLVEGCRAYDEYNDDSLPKIKELMNALNIEFNSINRELFDTFKLK